MIRKPSWSKGRALRLRVENPQPFGQAVRRREDAVLPTLVELLGATPHDGHWVVAVPDGADIEILERVERHHDTGYGAGRWNILLPSASHPADARA